MKLCYAADDTNFETHTGDTISDVLKTNSTSWDKISNHYSNQAFAALFASMSFSKLF